MSPPKAFFKEKALRGGHSWVSVAWGLAPRSGRDQDFMHLLKHPPASPPDAVIDNTTGPDYPGALSRDRRWVTFPRVMAAAVAVGLLVGGGVTAAVKLLDGNEPDRAAAALTQGHVVLGTVLTQLSDADEMADVREAAAAAAVAASRVRARWRALRTASDGPANTDVNEVFAGELALLDALSGLREMDTPSRRAWGPIRSQARESAVALRWPLRRLRRSGMRFRAAPLVAISSVETHLDELIVNGARRLAAWRRKVARLRRERSGEIAVIAAYATSVRSYLEQYGDLRTELDDWIAGVDRDGTTFDEAYDFLSQAAASRRSIRDGIAALDAPPAVASTHNELLTVIDSAIAAVDAAYDGIFEYELDFELKYRDYKETPGWQDFKQESAEVAGRYGSVSATLDTLVAQEKREIEQRELPPKPRV